MPARSSSTPNSRRRTSLQPYRGCGSWTLPHCAGSASHWRRCGMAIPRVPRASHCACKLLPTPMLLRPRRRNRFATLPARSTGCATCARRSAGRAVRTAWLRHPSSRPCVRQFKSPWRRQRRSPSARRSRPNAGTGPCSRPISSSSALRHRARLWPARGRARWAPRSALRWDFWPATSHKVTPGSKSRSSSPSCSWASTSYASRTRR